MKYLNKLVDEHPTLMISKPGCVFCTQAKKLFDKKMKNVHVMEIEKMKSDEAAEVIGAVRDEYKHMTFPIIFVDGEFIGGYDDLKEFYESDKENEL